MSANPTSNQEATLSGILKSFQTATGMGIRIVTAQGPQTVCACENSFCARLRSAAQAPNSCAGLLEFAAETVGGPVVISRCAAGLQHVSLPMPFLNIRGVRVESGQIFLTPPQRSDFDRVRALFPRWQGGECPSELATAFFATPVLTPEQFNASTELLLQLLLSLEPLVGKSVAPRLRARPDPVETATQYIERNIERAIRLSEVAAHAGVSAGYLCRAFKRHRRQTPNQYIAALRVERAKRLLAANGSRALDAAYAAGFQSLRQFNHVFKTRTGLTPSQYRLRAA